MKVGDLVRNKLKPYTLQLGLIIELRDSLFFEDVHCNKWNYPVHVRVIYSNGNVETSLVDICDLILIN